MIKCITNAQGASFSAKPGRQQLAPAIAPVFGHLGHLQPSLTRASHLGHQPPATATSHLPPPPATATCHRRHHRHQSRAPATAATTATNRLNLANQAALITGPSTAKKRAAAGLNRQRPMAFQRDCANTLLFQRKQRGLADAIQKGGERHVMHDFRRLVV
jgi:hypothetical protein